jgi:hypothetical protein
MLARGVYSSLCALLVAEIQLCPAREREFWVQGGIGLAVSVLAGNCTVAVRLEHLAVGSYKNGAERRISSLESLSGQVDSKTEVLMV